MQTKIIHGEFEISKQIWQMLLLSRIRDSWRDLLGRQQQQLFILVVNGIWPSFPSPKTALALVCAQTAAAFVARGSCVAEGTLLT